MYGHARIWLSHKQEVKNKMNVFFVFGLKERRTGAKKTSFRKHRFRTYWTLVPQPQYKSMFLKALRTITLLETAMDLGRWAFQGSLENSDEMQLNWQQEELDQYESVPREDLHCRAKHTYLFVEE